jgi:hypothetical protein
VTDITKLMICRGSVSPSRYLGEAETQQIVITRPGKPAGVLIGFESQDDWLDYRLENDPTIFAPDRAGAQQPACRPRDQAGGHERNSADLLVRPGVAPMRGRPDAARLAHSHRGAARHLSRRTEVRKRFRAAASRRSISAVNWSWRTWRSSGDCGRPALIRRSISFCTASHSRLQS